MLVQEYMLHLQNGEVILSLEELEKDRAKKLIEEFEAALPDTILQVGDIISGYFFIPARSILYISTGNVRVIKDSAEKRREWLVKKEREERREAYHAEN